MRFVSARFFNWLLLVFLAFTLFIAVTGGFEVSVFGRLVSAHRPARGVRIVLLLAAVRLLFFDLRGRPGFALAARRRRRMTARLASFRDPVRSDAPAARLPLLAAHTGWAFLGLCAFAVLFLHAQMAAMYSVPDLGDPLLSIWRMGWVNHWVQGDPRPLFSPNIFYPQPLTFTYSDSMILPALAGFPLLAAGVHPVIAYNVLLISTFVMSGLAMYLLAVRLTGSPRAAFISAILFGFYPFRFEHYSHFELQWTMWMPLALLALHEYFDTLKIRYVIAAALLLAAQLYSSMYFAVFFCLYLVPVLLILVWVKRIPLKRLWKGAAIALVLTSLLAIPLIRPYEQAQQVKGERDIPAVTFYSAEPDDYIRPHPRIATYDGLLPHSEPERALFPGLLSISLATAALVPPFGAVRLAYAAGMLLGFECSLGFHGTLYPALYEWFQPIRGLRVPARFSLIVGMTLALLAGFGCVRLFRFCRTRTLTTVVFISLLAASFVDLRAKLDLVPVWIEPPSIYVKVANRPDVVLAEFPWWSDRPEIGAQFPFMYFSLWHWANMVNGASGFEPPHYQQFLEDIHRFPEPGALAALQARGVTHVTINCAFYSAERNCHSLLDDLDQSPRFHKVAASRWEGDIVALYELVPAR
jgi:hypothetical protein